MADPQDTPPISAATDTPSTPDESYVRTFATDAAAVEAGKTPDFTKKSAARPTETREDILARLAAKNSGPRAEALNLDNASLELGDMAPKTGQRPAERLVSATPEAPPVVAPAKEAAREEPPPPVVSTAAPIHTYKTDLAEEVASSDASRSSILAAEADAKRTPAQAPRAEWNLPLVAGGVALIVLTLAGGYFAYSYATRPQTVAITPETPTRIFVDERVLLSGSGPALSAALAQSIATPPAINAIRFIATPDSAATTSVFNALKLPTPDILRRNILVVGSMAGVVNARGNSSLFFILAVPSYGETFAGMLAWEPRMLNDLVALYPNYPAPGPTIATTTVATTTIVNGKKVVVNIVATTTIPGATGPARFRDEVVLSHDVRIARDPSGRSVLLYGYWDPHTLLIARDEAAYAALLDRLANSRTQ